jgi:hypothetical protein
LPENSSRILVRRPRRADALSPPARRFGRTARTAFLQHVAGPEGGIFELRLLGEIWWAGFTARAQQHDADRAQLVHRDLGRTSVCAAYEGGLQVILSSSTSSRDRAASRW